MLKKTKKPADAAPAGLRVLAFGRSVEGLSAGPLAAATIVPAGIDELAKVRASGCDLVLIDADAWEPQPLAAAIQALAATPKPPPVLLTGERLQTTVVRNLLRLERSDVLEAPFTDEQVTQAVEGLLEGPAAAPAAPSADSSRCWAVTGAVGGSGATTLAIEVATALAARSGKDKSVCLIDLNLADGAAAAYLGMQASMHLEDFGQTADRIDAAMLQAFVTPVSKQLDLLAGPRSPDAFDAITRDAVLRVLEVACECYEWVILDMPRHRRSWTLEALSGCDEVLVVSELTVPALLAARSLAEEIEEALGHEPTPKIILNRLSSRMFGPAPSMGEAERALGRKADAGVSSDWEAAAASANLGGPIAQHRPKSKIVQDVQKLVERLAAEPARKADIGKRAA
ncbi:AAA family ATPase [Phenylobacterium sp.]|jgi:pilus assembly protein CpaE|uniref:AAA family ATPase n=1 Tax=Phenylobacterium sp. TaxID=1871053 RepID=UPI002F95CD7A